jgi:hypothetical protein
MSIDKRLISTGAGLCTSDTLDVFEDSSCIALYKLNYDGSDASGNYDGTATSVTFNTPGYIDYAADFNGSGSRIDSTSISNWPSGNAARSISFWMYSDSYAGGGIVSYGTGAQNQGFAFYIISSQLLMTFYGINANINYALSTGQWYHIVATHDGTTFKAYINGSQEYSDTRTLNTGTTKFRIGGVPWNDSSEFFNGKIDQVRVFNKALSSSEVTKLYRETSCIYTCTTDTNGFPSTASSDLAAYWKFDGDATDETGSYNGTRNGGYSWVGGRYGSAFQSNGSTGYISTSLTLPSTNYAFSYWAYNNGGDHQWIIGTEGSGTGISMKCRFATNQIAWTNWNVEAYEPTVSFKEGWNHVVQQISSNGKQIYLNGSLAASNSTTSITNNSNIGVRIGGYPPFSYFSSCPIDQIRYYTKALSSSEITALYEEEQQCYITVDSTDPFGDSSNIALYKLENNANDSTGSYNGTASNITYGTNSIIGTYAAVFNGSSSSITTSMASSNFGTGGIASFSWWWKPNTSGTTVHFLFEGDVENTYGVHTGGGAGTLGLRVLTKNTSNVSTLLDVSNAYTTGVWQHHTVTIGGGKIKLYRNGSQIGSTTYSGTLASCNSFQIGKRATSYYYSGSIDQFRVLNKVLDGDEVWKIYAEGAKG